MGDIVRVKDGYTKYLLPRSMAIIANEKNTRQLDIFKEWLLQKLKKRQASLNWPNSKTTDFI